MHRNLSDIINIIDNSEISSRAKYMARKIFTVFYGSGNGTSC